MKINPFWYGVFSLNFPRETPHEVDSISTNGQQALENAVETLASKEQTGSIARGTEEEDRLITSIGREANIPPFNLTMFWK